MRERGGGRRIHFIRSGSLKTIDPRTPKMSGRRVARRVFTDQADIACTKREAPLGVFGEARKLHPTKNHWSTGWGERRE